MDFTFVKVGTHDTTLEKVVPLKLDGNLIIINQ